MRKERRGSQARALGKDEHGIWEVEGFLLWNAEVEEARRRAREFTDLLPWLTTGQRDDVERVYVADRTADSRAMLARICERAGELRLEYTARYVSLRRRCVAVSAAVACAAVGLGAIGALAGLGR
ncbi:hypothetical protein SAMN05216223_108160 [Actinacidiphila yanglinensis]|uniref:Uncharacterized protein n=1 Tax=Actinacidiphila yanglinensis TaxID=310779 RepID=A0A1H6C8F9_9ACTN|nr:hypothetical protein [Actinacidiphila yanglinensis]SEG69192.1 hypothetical protein SAMN05216223_108160 [Actinacidiphila yanglinensis]